MRLRSNVLPVLLAAALAVTLAACGDNDNNDNFGEEEPTRTPTAGGRTATPTPQPTDVPTDVATPTATEGGADTPTSTATPSGPACVAGDQIVVVESLNQNYGAAVVDLLYPGSVLVPGTGVDQSVVDRVDFAATGITTVQDADVAGSDGVDDTLTAGFVSINDNPSGTYATITFDCIEGQPAPAAGDFTCTVTSASSSEGRDITSSTQCSIVVTGP